MDLTSLQFIKLEKQHIPLVNKFYKQVYKKGMAKKSDQVFVLKGQEIQCAARLKEVDSEWLLTGVACTEGVRGKGIASLLLQNMLKRIEQSVYCFPYPHLQLFYEKQGFECCTEAQLPTELAIRYQRYNSRKPLLCMLKPATLANHETV